MNKIDLKNVPSCAPAFRIAESINSMNPTLNITADRDLKNAVLGLVTSIFCFYLAGPSEQGNHVFFNKFVDFLEVAHMLRA